jgi:dTMP kinase
MFVVIEGIEGSGKTTLLAGLAEKLSRTGREVVVTREPGGTPLGDSIRAVFVSRMLAIEPLAEALLVNASRAQHVDAVIRPALKAGRIVICDRFVDSTLAYQGYGRGLDLEELRRICDIATRGLEPDLVLLIDMPYEVSQSRLQQRDEALDRIEQENGGFHERVRQGFLALAKSPRHCVLDGRLPPERLLEEALSAVHERLSTPLR